MKVRVLVTGSSGFLGSHLVDVLSSRGYEVVLFDRIKSNYNSKGHEEHIGSILDEDSLYEAAKTCNYIYHLAGIADITECIEKSNLAVDINIIGTKNILECCKRMPHFRRVYFASTVYVYSQQGGIYKATKQSCELLIEEYQKYFNIDYTVLRFGSLFGPRSGPSNSIYKMINQAIVNNRIVRSGTGNEVREYIYIKDAVDVCVDLMESSESLKNVIIKGYSSMLIGDITKMIAEILNTNVQVVFDGSHIEGHYTITPYSFKPQFAKQVFGRNSTDFGEAILAEIYDHAER